MLADGTRTATVGYGSRMEPRPRPWTRLRPPSRPVSGTVGVARWTGQPPRFPSAPSPAGPHRCSGRPRPSISALPQRLFAPGSADVTAPLASLPGSAAPLGPQAASACQTNAVLPYVRYYGSNWWHAGGCARRPETDRETCVPARTMPPIRVPRLPVRQPGNSGGARGRPLKRQGADLLGRPRPVTIGRTRRVHAFRRLASGAAKAAGGRCRAFTIPPARPAHAERLANLPTVCGRLWR